MICFSFQWNNKKVKNFQTHGSWVVTAQDVNLFVAESNLTDEIQLHECYMDPLWHGRHMVLLLPGECASRNCSKKLQELGARGLSSYIQYHLIYACISKHMYVYTCKCTYFSIQMESWGALDAPHESEQSLSAVCVPRKHIQISRTGWARAWMTGLQDLQSGSELSKIGRWCSIGVTNQRWRKLYVILSYFIIFQVTTLSGSQSFGWTSRFLKFGDPELSHEDHHWYRWHNLNPGST